MKRLVAIVLILAVLVPTAAAQDGDTCDVATIQAESVGMLESAATIEDLSAASAALREAIADCADLNFSGNGNSVIGPVELEGLYLIEYSTTGRAFNLEPTAMDTDELLFSAFDTADENVKGSTTLEFDGGRYVFNVLAGEWSVVFTKLE